MEGWDGNTRIVRIILISAGILAFTVLIVVSYKIINSSSPYIISNCEKTAVSLKNESIRVGSAEEGAQVIFDSFKENATFTSNTLDVCNVNVNGYVYATESNKSYVVCGDGKIYGYEDACSDKGGISSFVSMLTGSTKSAEIK